MIGVPSVTFFTVIQYNQFSNTTYQILGMITAGISKFIKLYSFDIIGVTQLTKARV